MNKLYSALLLTIMALGLVACTSTKETPKHDETPPHFLNANNGKLPSIFHPKGQAIDLFEGVNVIDDVDTTIQAELTDDGGYNKDIPGVYTLTFSATDQAGNHTSVTRTISVQNISVEVFDALVINGEGMPYVYNDPTALNYTTSGTNFRRVDQIQVMSTEFFTDEYNRVSSQHTSNGGVPYLPHGVIVLVDHLFEIKLMRFAGETVEVRSNNSAFNGGLTWDNSINAVEGGGNFKGILTAIDSALPQGGHIIFTGNIGVNSKPFLVQQLFNPNYVSGAISLSERSVDVRQVSIAFVDDFEKTIPDPDAPVGEIGAILVNKLNYDGVPLTTYYKNDQVAKPVIFFFHGFGSSKDVGIMGRGEALANLGFYVIAVDAYLHGERQPDFFKNASYGDKQIEIINIAMRTAEDAMHLYRKYFSNNPQIASGVYAYGVSLGAMTSFYLTTIMEEVVGMVSILGAPSFMEFYEYKQAQYSWTKNTYYYTNLSSYRTLDPLINHERFEGKHLFMAGGTTDTVVPMVYAERLASTLNSPNALFKSYNTGHASTAVMLQDSYSFLTSIKG